MAFDGRAATLKAREYLVESHGPQAVWNFQVDDVEYDEQNQTWLVNCSFFPSMFGIKPLKYEVKIFDDGGIKSAKKIA